MDIIIIFGIKIIIVHRIVEFGPCPIYAHGSSFSPNPGIIMIMIIMVSRAEIIIIIVNRIINYNCKSDYNLLNLDLVQYMLMDRPFHRNQG